jgi:uncharacterized protein (DUF305 family)
MRESDTKYLEEVAKRHGFDFSKVSRRIAQQNPIENSMWENMIDGALKALEIVAIASFDFKLTAIVKLLQSWLKDRREEKAKKKQDYAYGHGSYDAMNQTVNYNADPYGGRSFY